MKVRTLLLITLPILVVSLATTGVALARGPASPQEQIIVLLNPIPFQGVLTDPFGFPVPNGTHQVSFAIYDATSGGNRVGPAPSSPTTRETLDVQTLDGSSIHGSDSIIVVP